ncbi:hypothetical protein B0H10DRAFT_1964507 [Mycena sp. CBHHK59/15]|nr:hypothetical protein B0H10DRAFT_1964507 [Mycena sp. CBHHK59/15]
MQQAFGITPEKSKDEEPVDIFPSAGEDGIWRKVAKQIRTPAELKDKESTWDQIFHDHGFTARQKELIRNFNIRCECNDARDDHYEIMRKKMAQQKEYTSNSILGVHDEFVNDIEVGDFGDEDMGNDEDKWFAGHSSPKNARI